MRRLKLGRLLDTLPERLALARQHDLTHMQFLEQLFSDEVQRRDSDSAGLRARAAKLDPSMTLEAWDDTAAITYDRAVWSELVSMRFVDHARNAFILGPVGVGKTFL
ncbi:MAG TPA: ATP-binding protein, partial [Jatrophihabitantaceae bacterium]|nr:ATP-binding protein [Jatrophihabitantaceae bacterium]